MGVIVAAVPMVTISRRQTMNPSILKPNLYFLVYVFDKNKLPPKDDVVVHAGSTFHKREYPTVASPSTAAGPTYSLNVRVYDRIEDIEENPDNVKDNAKEDSPFEFRIIDLNNDADNNLANIKKKMAELDAKGYKEALHWRLVCARVVNKL
jgi:hypothetical protein